MIQFQNKMEHPLPLQLPFIKNHFFDTVANIPTFKKILSQFTKFQYVTRLLFYVDNKKAKNESSSDTRKHVLTTLKYKIVFHLKRMVLGNLPTFTTTAGSVWEKKKSSAFSYQWL